MIGEQFDHGDEICGAVVNVRNRQEKIALWTKNAANEVAQVTFFCKSFRFGGMRECRDLKKSFVYYIKS